MYYNLSASKHANLSHLLADPHGAALNSRASTRRRASRLSRIVSTGGRFTDPWLSPDSRCRGGAIPLGLAMLANLLREGAERALCTPQQCAECTPRLSVGSRCALFPASHGTEGHSEPGCQRRLAEIRLKSVIPKCLRAGSDIKYPRGRNHPSGSEHQLAKRVQKSPSPPFAP